MNRVSRRNFIRVVSISSLIAAIESQARPVFAALPATNMHSPRRYAFAHYMAGLCTRGRNQSIEEWKADIRDAIAYGIDGWQFNFGVFSGRFRRNIQRFVKALDELGSEARHFRFFPSFDCNNKRVPNSAEVQEWFHLYYHHPNHFRLDDRPLLTVWQARDVGNEFFVELKATLSKTRMPIAFIPWISTRGNRVELEWLFHAWSSIDGFNPWVPSRTSEQATQLNFNVATMCRKYNKTLVAGLGFNALPINKIPKYVDKHAARAVTAQMLPLISGPLDDTHILIVATWNDFGEDHHITPHDPWGPVRGIHPVWNHVGYAEVLKYYLDWWKTGAAPSLIGDKLVVFHLAQLANEGIPPFPINDYKPDKAQDIVHLTAMLRSPGEIFVRSGDGDPSRFHAPEGISHWETPARPGVQTYGLVRDGRETIIKHSNRRIESPPVGAWSWSHYSEVAEA